MIEPIKSPVRPRVIVKESGENSLLEDLVASAIQSRDGIMIAYSAKTVIDTTITLQHIVYVFASEPSLRVTIKNLVNSPLFESPSVGVIGVGDFVFNVESRMVVCELADWGRDEWIEYLLSTHRDQCTSVMQRLLHDPAIESLEGNSFILRLVLDEMATDAQLLSVDSALRRIIDKRFADATQREQVAIATFTSLIGAVNSAEDQDLRAFSNLSNEQQYLLQLPAIQMLLASESAVNQLQTSLFLFEKMWPRILLHAVAPTVSDSAAIRQTLQEWVQTRSHPHLCLAVSLLNAAKVTWKWPECSHLDWFSRGLDLTEAILDGADCSQMPIAGGSLKRASLADTQLTGCILRKVNAYAGCFRGANLHGVQFSNFNGTRGNFIEATLTEAWGKSANFCVADFCSANLSGSRLPKCDFTGANFTGANLTRAALRECCFSEAILDDACFQYANLALSDFEGIDLTVADFRHALFQSAKLSHAKLEGMDLPHADFRSAELDRALLSGSVMPRANFCSACLVQAKLAFVEWESVDLRSADLRGATFHMGSSRCGLVGSSIPMYGSRTEFYTDELHEQNFKPPEEIRKANLRGADLRGAIIDGVDFYLVDLRDARYDLRQQEQLRRTGAILIDRSC